MARLEQVRRAVQALPRREREVYRLSAAEGLDHFAIGARLGMNVAEVEVALADALVRLDRLLGEADK